MIVKLDHFPRDRGENKKYLEPPTSSPMKNILKAELLKSLSKKVPPFLHGDGVFPRSRPGIQGCHCHILRVKVCPTLRILGCQNHSPVLRPFWGVIRRGPRCFNRRGQDCQGNKGISPNQSYAEDLIFRPSILRDSSGGGDGILINGCFWFP